MRRRLLPLVDWVTPNMGELGVLTGHVIGRREDLPDAARLLQAMGSELHVVVTVGALDVLVLEEGGCGEEDVGVVGGVGEELLVDDGEEVVAEQEVAHLFGADDQQKRADRHVTHGRPWPDADDRREQRSC